MARIFKYWKPIGVTSSFNLKESNNILKSGQSNENILKYFNKSIPSFLSIGRLDKESNGLLLLTNSYQIVIQITKTYNSINQNKNFNKNEKEKFYGSKYEKIYHVKTLNYVSDILLEKLREGVSITTMGRRKIGSIKSQRKTLPCRIERTYDKLVSMNDDNNLNNIVNVEEEKKLTEQQSKQSQLPPQQSKQQKTNDLYFALKEGRNRQIRKMIGSVGHSVQSLCRVSIGKVTLEGLKGPGDILPLTKLERESLEIFISDELEEIV